MTNNTRYFQNKKHRLQKALLVAAILFLTIISVGARDPKSRVKAEEILNTDTVTCVDFSTITPGTSVEGLGTINSNLNISTSSQNAVAIAEGVAPSAFGAPNNELIMNNGIGERAGFFDESRIHDYTFSFAPGVTIRYFSVTMLDFGDYNANFATEHEVSLIAYNSLGESVSSNTLSFTSDGQLLPRGGSAGDLYFTGDAVSANANEPGRYVFEIFDNDISRLEFQYQSNAPDYENEPTDPYFALTDLCFEVEEEPPQPPAGIVCADFTTLAPGDSVEGLGAVYPTLNISTSTGNGVAIAEGVNPSAYGAPNDALISNNGVGELAGFFDRDREHNYSFSFAENTTVDYFTLKMLDFGDYNFNGATEHRVTLSAYNVNNDLLTSDTLFFTSDGQLIPRGGSAGDLYFTGDAVAANEGEPGRFTFIVSENNISRLELDFSSNVGNEATDPYFALAVLCFEPETPPPPPPPPPPPSDTPESCEDLGYTTIAEDSWDEHVIDGMNPITLGYARPSAADYAIVNTGWEWTGNADQHQVTEMHSVETPFGTVTSQDYGDHELAGQVLWFGAPQGDFTQPSLQVTIDYAGDGSDPGSHRSHGLIAWCDNPDVEPPQNEPLTCEDIGLEAVSTAEWSTHVIRGMTPVTENFTQPADANYVIVNTAWAWSGLPDQHQYDEKHSVATPLGTAVSDDYGDAELEGELIWYDALQGAFGAGSLDATIDFAGDGSDPGSHISKGMVNWCFDPAAPDASTTLLQPMTDDGAQVEVAFACTDAAPNLVSAGLNDYTVENGQVLWLVPSEDSFSNTLDGGLTAIYGPAFSLAVTCADADGNQSTTIITPDLGGG